MSTKTINRAWYGVVLGMVLVLMSLGVEAHGLTPINLSIFKTIYTPSMPELNVPTLVSTSIPGRQDYNMVLFIESTGQPQEFRSVKKFQENKAVLSVEDSSSMINPEFLVDDDTQTMAEFDLDQDEGQAFVVLKTNRPVTANGLTLVLDDYVALPYTISVEARVNGTYKTIVGETILWDRTQNFPQVTSSEWRIGLGHSQLLRLRELELNDVEYETQEVGVEMIWVARPNETYKIYADAKRYVLIETEETGSLYPREEETVVSVVSGETVENPLFQEPDIDNDGVADLRDNCVKFENKDQQDKDANGRGDACEDYDRDGVPTARDNCPDDANRLQQDIDGDGIGDACDLKESRLTERLPWLLWGAVGLAALLILGMMLHTVKKS